MEDTQVRIPGRGVPRRVEVGVGTDLHRHHVLALLVALHHEFEVVAEVERDGRQREDVRIGGILEEGAVVEVDRTELEFLAQLRGQHAHGRAVLPDDAVRVVIKIAGQQGVAHVGGQFPVGNVDAPLQPGRGDLAELIVPAVVVEIEVLLIVSGVLEGGLEMRRDAERALARPAEGEETETGVGFHAEVAGILAEQHEAGLGVPPGDLEQLALRAGIHVEGILHVVLRAYGGAVEIVLEVVAGTDVQARDRSLAGPGLEAQVDLVVQARHAHRIGAGGPVAEDVVVQGRPVLVRDGVGVHAGIDGPLGAVPDEGGRDVAVEGVRVVLVGAVAAGAHLLDEGEGDAQLLVQEDGVLGDLGLGVLQVDPDVARIHGRVPDPADIVHAAVLLPVDHVVDEAGVRRVALAEVVGLHHRGLVGRLLPVEDALAAVAVVEQGEVECRHDVLGGEEVEVVRDLGLLGEQGPEIGEFRVRNLRVEVRQGAVRIAPGLLRVIEFHALVAAPLEPVVVLDRRAGHAQPGGVDVLALEGVIVEMGVVGGIRHEGLDLAEVGVEGPGDEPLVVERIRQGVGLQDARRRLQDAVPDVPLLLLDLVQRVGPRHLHLDALLHVVALALLAGEAGVPGLEGRLGTGHGVGEVDGVELVPERGVQQGLERIARAQAAHGVDGDGHGVQRLVRGGSIAHGDLLQRQRPPQLVPRHGVYHRVPSGRFSPPGVGKRSGFVAPGHITVIRRHRPANLLSGIENARGDKSRHGDRKGYARQ